jgi:anti-sigma factor RsiW
MSSSFDTHLTPEQLVDAAEAAQDASVAAHLGACDACRTKVAELRETMASVLIEDVRVPEPSPLFWDHFQERVSEAVEAERLSENVITRFVRSFRPAVLVPIAAASLVALGVLVTNVSRHRPVAIAPAQSSLAGDESASASSRELLRDSMDDDPSLQLIADLAVDVDWTAAEAASLAPDGSAEHAVSHMSAKDLKELQRLLRAELGS